MDYRGSKPIESLPLPNNLRNKFLKMVSNLYPEYEFGFESDYEGMGILEFYKKDKIHVYNWKFIHWFEFAMNSLCACIGNHPNNDINDCFDESHLRCQLFMILEWYDNPQKHIVEELYKHYLKIKN